jgi:thioredoxin reductase (NADPH)
VAAERYIEELNDFNQTVMKSEKRVLLLFGNVLLNESLEFEMLLEEVNRELDNNYKIVKVDIATKKSLIEKYAIKDAPAVVVLDKGKEIKRLKSTMDKEQLKCQLCC